VRMTFTLLTSKQDGKAPNGSFTFAKAFSNKVTFKRPRTGPSVYFKSECRALVEILVSHLSATNAERWGTLLSGWGTENSRSLGFARDDKAW